jgi:putative membrane protein insertion efficiency factor
MRRRYDPYGRRYRRRPRYDDGGGSCWRDACLIETGCCIGEAIGDSCLISSVLVLPRFLGALRSPGSAGMVAAIRVYQREVSAHRPAVCRFEPSCSQYGVEALQRFGAWRGSWLTMRRLFRCRPGGLRGADPVPLLTVG